MAFHAAFRAKISRLELNKIIYRGKFRLRGQRRLSLERRCTRAVPCRRREGKNSIYGNGGNFQAVFTTNSCKGQIGFCPSPSPIHPCSWSLIHSFFKSMGSFFWAKLGLIKIPGASTENIQFFFNFPFDFPRTKLFFLTLHNMIIVRILFKISWGMSKFLFCLYPSLFMVNVAGSFFS